MLKSIGVDLYLKITKKNGESHVQQHRVWDKDRFVQAIKDQHASAKDVNLRCTVQEISKDDYKKGRK